MVMKTGDGCTITMAGNLTIHCNRPHWRSATAVGNAACMLSDILCHFLLLAAPVVASATLHVGHITINVPSAYGGSARVLASNIRRTKRCCSVCRMWTSHSQRRLFATRTKTPPRPCRSDVASVDVCRNVHQCLERFVCHRHSPLAAPPPLFPYRPRRWRSQGARTSRRFPAGYWLAGLALVGPLLFFASLVAP